MVFRQYVIIKHFWLKLFEMKFLWEKCKVFPKRTDGNRIVLSELKRPVQNKRVNPVRHVFHSNLSCSDTVADYLLQ